MQDRYHCVSHPAEQGPQVRVRNRSHPADMIMI